MILDYPLLQKKGFEIPINKNLRLNQYLDIPVFKPIYDLYCYIKNEVYEDFQTDLIDLFNEIDDLFKFITLNINLKNEVSDIILKKFKADETLLKNKTEIINEYIILEGIDQLFFSFNCIDLTKNINDNSYSIIIKEDYSSIIDTKIWNEFYTVSESVFNMSVKVFEKKFSQFYAEAEADKIILSKKLYLSNNLINNNLIDFFELIHDNNLSQETIEYSLEILSNNYEIEKLTSLLKHLSKYIEILDYTSNYELIKTNRKFKKIDLFNLNYLYKLINNRIDYELKKGVTKDININKIIENNDKSNNNSTHQLKSDSELMLLFNNNIHNVKLFFYLADYYESKSGKSKDLQRTKFNHIYYYLDKKIGNTFYGDETKKRYKNIVKKFYKYNYGTSQIKSHVTSDGGFTLILDNLKNNYNELTCISIDKE